jgi:DNA-directed RNA polymerase subunit RPC12/RpoP
MHSFNKITIGYVLQQYVTLPNGTSVCTYQEFIAGEVEHETKRGEPISPDDIDTSKEHYCPFSMVQPEKVLGANEVRLSYPDGVCPECGEIIPENVEAGQQCSKCSFRFYNTDELDEDDEDEIETDGTDEDEIGFPDDSSDLLHETW